jgi:hypothetical protein
VRPHNHNHRETPHRRQIPSLANRRPAFYQLG